MVYVLYLVLRKARQRLADAEDGSRVSQFVLKALCERVRGAKHAPSVPRSVLKRRHGLAEIVERTAPSTPSRRLAGLA